VPHSWIRAFDHDASVRAVAVGEPVLATPLALMTIAAEPGSVLARAFARIAQGLRFAELFDQLYTRTEQAS